MRNLIFEENYEAEMKRLKRKISEKNYNDLDLFFCNTNLDSKQKNDLLKIISKIFADGEFIGHHSSCNSASSIVSSEK